MTVNNVFNTVMGMFIGIIILSALVALTTTLYVKKSPMGTKSQAPETLNQVRDGETGYKKAGIIFRVVRGLFMARVLSLVKWHKTPASMPEPVVNTTRIITPTSELVNGANEQNAEKTSGKSTPVLETVNNSVGVNEVIDLVKTENQFVTTGVLATPPESETQSDAPAMDKEPGPSQATDQVATESTETVKDESESGEKKEPEKASGSVFDLFTNVAAEETDSSKFAANIDNVDINDLQSLIGQLKVGRSK